MTNKSVLLVTNIVILIIVVQLSSLVQFQIEDEHTTSEASNCNDTQLSRI